MRSSSIPAVAGTYVPKDHSLRNVTTSTDNLADYEDEHEALHADNGDIKGKGKFVMPIERSEPSDISDASQINLGDIVQLSPHALYLPFHRMTIALCLHPLITRLLLDHDRSRKWYIPLSFWVHFH